MRVQGEGKVMGLPEPAGGLVSRGPHPRGPIHGVPARMRISTDTRAPRDGNVDYAAVLLAPSPSLSLTLSFSFPALCLVAFSSSSSSRFLLVPQGPLLPRTRISSPLSVLLRPSFPSSNQAAPTPSSSVCFC